MGVGFRAPFISFDGRGAWEERVQGGKREGEVRSTYIEYLFVGWVA